jgi:MFS family permease
MLSDQNFKEKNMTEETKYSSFRWFVLVTMIISVATSSLSLISPAPIIGDILKANSFPGMNAGGVVLLTMSSFNLFVAIACIGGGFLLDKFGFYRVYIFGIILICAGEFLVPVIGQTVWGMVFCRMLEGFGTGPVMSAGASIAANYFPYKERPMVNGFTGFSVMTGISVGLILVPHIAASTGSWVSAMSNIWPIGIAAIILNIIVAFGPKPPVVEEVKLPGASKSELGAAFKMPVTYFLIGFVFLMSWIFQAYNDITPNYITLDAPVGLGKSASLMSLSTYSFMLAAVITGFVNMKLFKGNIKPHLILTFLLGGLMSLTMLLPGVYGDNAIFMGCLAMTTFFYGFVNPLSLGYVSQKYPQHVTGRLGGIAQGVGIVGGFIGPTVGGIVLAVTNSYTIPIIILGGTNILGFILALFAPIKGDHKD